MPEGSGFITQAFLDALLKQSADDYRAVIRKCRTTKQREEDLMAGFEDGLRTMMTHLRGAGIVVVLKNED